MYNILASLYNAIHLYNHCLFSGTQPQGAVKALGRPHWLSWMRVRLETRMLQVRPPLRSATVFRRD